MEHIPVRQINTAQKEPALPGSFGIRDIGEELATKDMVQELHRHDFYFILVIKNGAGQHDIDFSSYPVGDNNIFVMRPGQVHQLVLKSGSTGFMMQFKDEFYLAQSNLSKQLLRKAAHVNHYQPDSRSFQKLLTILINIFEEYRGKREKYQEVIKASMNIFFIELGRLQSDHSRGNGNLYTQEQLENFSTLLATHAFHHKQVSEYAEMLHLSTWQLNAITKALLGKTCSAVINEHMILEAKRYLLATSDQVNQIADRLGYEDVSYFIRFFKKHTGYSPETFRQHFS